jgi:hypothetical protein
VKGLEEHDTWAGLSAGELSVQVQRMAKANHGNHSDVTRERQRYKPAAEKERPGSTRQVTHWQQACTTVNPAISNRRLTM